MRKVGFVYPRSFRRGPSHNYLARLLRNSREIAFVKKKLGREFRITKAENVILSSEMFFHSGAARMLTSALPDSALSQVKIVCYLRRPDQLAEVFFKQRLKTGRTRASFSEFWATRPSLFDYSSVLHAYASAFGRKNINVRIFERTKLSGGDVVGDFIETVGLPAFSPEPQVGSRANRSLSLEAAQAMGETAFSSPSERRATQRLLTQSEDTDVIRSRDVMDFETQLEILENSREDLEWVRKTFRPDLERLFSDQELSPKNVAIARSPEEKERRLALAREAVRSARLKVLASAS